jgi:hypothetical protein
MDARLENRPGEAGYSVIEGLIAAALLLIVTVGVIPLFTRSMINNLRGNDSTRISNGAVDELERATEAPFNSGDMSLAALADERIDTTVIALKQLPGNPAGGLSMRWEPVATLPSGDEPDMLRRRTLRQFTFSDFNALEPDDSFLNPLPEGTEEQAIHIKVVDLDFFDANRDPLMTEDPSYAVRLIKVF